MAETIKFHISTPGDFFSNINEVVEIVDRNGVCVIRGADFSEKEQFDAMISLGDIFGWYPNSQEKSRNAYQESHEFTIEQKNIQSDTDITNKKNKDKILVEWHMEHVGFINPAIGASWNMKIFTCDEDCGKTYFVDACEVFKQLNEDDINFLEKCQFALRHKKENENIEYVKKGVHPDGELLINPILFHRRVGDMKMVKIPPSDDGQQISELVFFESRKPTELEQLKFFDICRDISMRIFYDSGIRVVHRWKQNDLVITDLSRMYHAVTGGFKPEHRYFEGLWAHGHPGSKFEITES